MCSDVCGPSSSPRCPIDAFLLRALSLPRSVDSAVAHVPARERAARHDDREAEIPNTVSVNAVAWLYPRETPSMLLAQEAMQTSSRRGPRAIAAGLPLTRSRLEVSVHDERTLSIGSSYRVASPRGGQRAARGECEHPWKDMRLEHHQREY